MIVPLSNTVRLNYVRKKQFLKKYVMQLDLNIGNSCNF